MATAFTKRAGLASSSISLLLTLFLFSCPCYEALTVPNAKNLIFELPGQPANAPFSQYGGYINVGPQGRKALYYWLVEAHPSPATKPLVLWLNGGPGCSSVGNGLLAENGPWRVAGPAADQLAYNPSSWNKGANMIYLETPIGVGYSYSNTSSDYEIGDYQTAQDNLEFLLGFLKQYPEFMGRPFYITGESYAGHYIPQLALLIQKHNAVVGTVKINLKGIAAGNPLTDFQSDNLGMYQAAYGHNMISEPLYNQILRYCNFTFSAYISGITSKGCEAVAGWSRDGGQFGSQLNGYDVYSVYTPLCQYDGPSQAVKLNHHSRLAKHIRGLAAVEATRAASATRVKAATAPPKASGVATKHQKGRKLLGISVPLLTPLMETQSANTVPKPFSDTSQACDGNWITDYLNRPEVQLALHANRTKLTYPWSSCVDQSPLQYIGDDFPGDNGGDSVLPIYRQLLKSKIRIWIYGGETDLVVAWPGTRAAFTSLKLPQIRPFLPWFYLDQVGGTVQEFQGLSLISVRGAGHLVPRIQPERSLFMFQSFLAGKLLPTTQFATDPF